MALAVKGLSPVTITVRRPIRRRRSKRSAIPGLRMSSSTTMPATRVPSLTNSGVAPLPATSATSAFDGRRAPMPSCFWTWRRMASGAPLRIGRPSGRSMPLIRVCAVKGIKRDPVGAATSTLPAFRPCRSAPSPSPNLWNSSTMLLPSGVSSAAEARAASRPTSTAVKPSKGTNCVARRLPTVIVPVLSNSRVSTSPATSTAFPLLAMMLARSARSMPAMPMAASRAPIVVGIRQTKRATKRGHVGAKADKPLADPEIILHVQLDVVGHRPERGGHDEEDQREHGQHDRQGDFIGRPLADGAFDQGDHAVQEGVAGAGRDLRPRCGRRARGFRR